jgi:hypothetical protein
VYNFIKTRTRNKPWCGEVGNWQCYEEEQIFFSL